MRNLLRVGDFDPTPILQALACMPELWNENTLRTEHDASPHRAVDDVWLFFNDLDEPQAVANDINVIPYRAWTELPQVRPVVFDLMRRVEGVQLGRVLITRLPPGKTIRAHEDGGAPATYYDRYQLCLQNLPGSSFRVGPETITMRPGEVWWFQNQFEHEVINNSADDRLALIVDIRRG